MHPLGSPYVREQIGSRTHLLNEKRIQPDGEFVLYWMQNTQRLEENWALRYATIEADRIGKPLLIHQGLDPRSPLTPYASARSHAFILQGAAELARRAEQLGYAYQFVMRRTRDHAQRAVDRLARRASLVVTDLYPTGGVLQRTQRVANRVECRLAAVDSVGIVAASAFPREEYAARTIRPKLSKLLDDALEPVEDRLPRRALPATLLASLQADMRATPLDLAHADLRAELLQCDVDHSVAPVQIHGGRAAARERLQAFVTDGLARYSERRTHPSDAAGSSLLSPYLHHGMISAAEVTRVVRGAGQGSEADAFLNEMCTWRELALNFCTRNASYSSLDALPEWARRSMARHADDEREHIYSLEELEAGMTHSPLWNAGQRELVETGSMHNVMRMLWGKSVITWTRTYADALATLIHLNDRYALDGRDPNGYAGIQWCFGKFDRPFASRPVWGTIRPMSLERAHTKYDVDAYVERWRRGALGEEPREAVRSHVAFS